MDTFFTQDYINFFEELAANNHREWFHANKKRYENSVKKPFAAFVTEMIRRIQEEESDLLIEAKDAILRINRDIRFAKDKTPYNTHCSAIIGPGGRKDKSIPGLYLQFSGTGVGVYGGAYMISKEQLQGIRTSIASDLASFDRIIQHVDFKKVFGAVRGEAHKRIPKEFAAAHQEQPLIANKQFTYAADLPPDWLLKPNFPDKIMEYWHIARPLKDFLYHAMEGATSGK